MEIKKKFLNDHEAGAFLGLSVHTMRSRRSNGLPPRYYKVAGKIQYKAADLEAFLESCAVEPTRVA
jgi:hypothetical protein